MNNDRINNAQRKALVDIIDGIMERKIQEAKDASGEIINGVKAELGIDAIDEQIKELEDQIAMLKQKKKQLGFESYGKLIDGSKTKALVDERLAESSISVRSLELDRDRVISSIWTTTSLSEAKELAASVWD